MSVPKAASRAAVRVFARLSSVFCASHDAVALPAMMIRRGYANTSHAMDLSSSDVSYNQVGFMFPGQGAQRVGMAASLCDEVVEAKHLFEIASDIIGYDLLAKCINGPKEDLDRTAIAQTAIFVSSMAALEKLKRDDLHAYSLCTVTMGLSLGEYSALCFAGAFSFEDGVKLTQARGEAMQVAADACESGMVAVTGLDISGVEAICKAAEAKTGIPISIGNYLMDGSYAVSGAMSACRAVIEIAPSMGARDAVQLNVAGAFHTDLMEPAVIHLKKALDLVTIRSPRIPVISNVSAAPHGDPELIRKALLKQVTTPVQWENTIKAMIGAPEFQTCYEIGPGSVCKGIVKRHNRRVSVVSLSC